MTVRFVAGGLQLTNVGGVRVLPPSLSLCSQNKEVQE